MSGKHLYSQEWYGSQDQTKCTLLTDATLPAERAFQYARSAFGAMPQPGVYLFADRDLRPIVDDRPFDLFDIRLPAYAAFPLAPFAPNTLELPHPHRSLPHNEGALPSNLRPPKHHCR